MHDVQAVAEPAHVGQAAASHASQAVPDWNVPAAQVPTHVPLLSSACAGHVTHSEAAAPEHEAHEASHATHVVPLATKKPAEHPDWQTPVCSTLPAGQDAHWAPDGPVHEAHEAAQPRHCCDVALA